MQATFTPYKEVIAYVMEKRGDTLEKLLVECTYGGQNILLDIIEPIQRHGLALRKFTITGWSADNDEMGVVEVKLAKRDSQLDFSAREPFAIMSTLVTEVKVDWASKEETIGDLTVDHRGKQLGLEATFLDMLSGGRLARFHQDMMSSRGMVPFLGRCPQLREVEFKKWRQDGSNCLIYLMLTSLKGLRRFTLRDSEGYPFKAVMRFYDKVTERKCQPMVTSLFRFTEERDEVSWLRETKLVATRVLEGTLQKRETPLWGSDSDEDESESEEDEVEAAPNGCPLF